MVRVRSVVPGSAQRVPTPQTAQVGSTTLSAGAEEQRLRETALDTRKRLTPDSSRVVIVFVGLPARGKSMQVHKLEQFLVINHVSLVQKHNDVRNTNLSC